MKWLMKLLGVDSEMMELSKSGVLGTEEAMKAFRMSDDEKLTALRQFCHAYGTEDFTNFDVVTMDKVVHSIGQILNERGGVEEMRRLFDQLGSVAGIRSLDLRWDGIGEWSAMMPACELGESSGSEEVGDTLRSAITANGHPVEAEFSDGVICTGEMRDDLTGNFDLSMRVSQPTPTSTVLECLTVKMPWGEKEETLTTIASGPLPDGLSITLVVHEPAPWLDDRSNLPQWADVYWEGNLLGRMTIRAEA